MKIRLRSQRLFLREIEAADVDRLARYDERNRSRFERFAPERTLDAVERERNFARRLEMRERGLANTFAVFARSVADDEIDDASPHVSELAGLVGFDAFAIGPPAFASISYSIDGGYEGRGFASEAVATALRYAFVELSLARVEATVDPENLRSRRLLERLGFVVAYEIRDVPAHVAAFMRPQSTYAVTAQTFRPAAIT